MNAWMRLLVNVVVLTSFLATSGLATEYRMPPYGDDLVGENSVYTVQEGDSLTTIRKEFGVSYEELIDANPHINFYKLKVGQDVIISKQFILPRFRRGIVINIPELRLYYFTPDGNYVYTFPVGLGRPGWRTPLFSTKVRKKAPDPVWYVPDSIRNYVLNKTGELLPDSIPPGPNNPLGRFAIYLQKPGYLIHGTNRPSSVGTFISSGCMRLLREPIEQLYYAVQPGTPVYVIHHPIKAGWRGKTLYLETHEPIKSYLHRKNSPLNNIDVASAIHHAIHLRPARIDWDAVRKNISQHLGIPEPIGQRYKIINFLTAPVDRTAALPKGISSRFSSLVIPHCLVTRQAAWNKFN